MAFAAGMHVFPGGRIDESDFDEHIRFTRDIPDPGRMNAGMDLARALIVCAVRELFEETGVLLAVDSSGQTPVEDDTWESDRASVASSSIALADLLEQRDLSIDPGLLPLWTHWVTPEVESRRYDVRFFVAGVPDGQVARDVSGEADHTVWFDVNDAMAEYAAGGLPMLPPTAATIADLLGVPTVVSAMESASERAVRPLMPRPRSDGAGGIAWDLIDFRDGSVILPLATEPAGSEVHGTGAPS